MDKLSIKDFHRFMRGPFAVSIGRAFRSHHIFCEADLQSFAWRKIKSYLERHEEEQGKFRVLNKPFLRDCGIYPDLVVFRRTIPWVVVELKESRMLTANAAKRERDKLLETKRILHPKRGYLVYVARRGYKRAIVGPKGKGGRYFFEVPVILRGKSGKAMTATEMKEWRTDFRSWSKYVMNQV